MPAPCPGPLPDALLDAYRRAEYRVDDGGWRFTLRIGAASAPLAACHRAHASRRSAYLTAWNPCGQLAATADNVAAQHALVESLRQQGYALLRGVGASPTEDWSPEDSVLVLGLERAAAVALGREYRQNAIVWSGADATPELVVVAG